MLLLWSKRSSKETLNYLVTLSLFPLEEDSLLTLTPLDQRYWTWRKTSEFRPPKSAISRTEKNL